MIKNLLDFYDLNQIRRVAYIMQWAFKAFLFYILQAILLNEVMTSMSIVKHIRGGGGTLGKNRADFPNWKNRFLRVFPPVKSNPNSNPYFNSLKILK